MKFDELDERMRVFETAHDHCVLPGIYIVARLDGRGFTRWRNEDAHRNALNSHGYWCLRRDGKEADQAATIMEGLSVAEKNELLWQHGINFNDLPNWQKRGVGIYAHCPWQSRLYKDFNLPMKDDYSQFIRNLTIQ